MGKNLVFADESGKEHKIKIVGVYNTSDPIFTGNQILIPCSNLIKFNNEVIANAKGAISITSDKAYKILVDDAKKSSKCTIRGFLILRTVYNGFEC